MKVTDAQIRSAYGQRTARAQSRRSGCLRPEQIHALWSGESVAEERERWVTHIIGCSECARESQALRELQTLPPVLGAAAKGDRLLRFPQRAWGRPTWRVLAAAACLVFSVSMSLVLWRSGSLPEGGSTGERGERGAIADVSPPNRATLSAPPDALRWAAVGGADEYAVTLFDAESAVLWRSERLTTTNAVLPAELRNRPNPEGSYFWRVTAYVGLDHIDSALLEFTVQRSAVTAHD